MGHWKLPKTVEEAETLRDIVYRVLPAENASETLYGVLGSDDLFDRISKARKAHPWWDVGSLVVNAVAEIYFTADDAQEIASAEVAAILRDIVDSRVGDKRDIFYTLQTIHNADQALDRFAHWLEIRPQDRSNWEVARDPNGFDWIARNSGGDMFRLSAIDDFVMEIGFFNAEIYLPVFKTALAARH
jgi:hypothetical protein